MTAPIFDNVRCVAVPVTDLLDRPTAPLMFSFTDPDGTASTSASRPLAPIDT